MLNDGSVSLVICHKLITALLFDQYELISLLLQQSVTLHEFHYSGALHSQDYMKPHTVCQHRSQKCKSYTEPSSKTLQ